jgi:hypothetical protein
VVAPPAAAGIAIGGKMGGCAAMGLAREERDLETQRCASYYED